MRANVILERGFLKSVFSHLKKWLLKTWKLQKSVKMKIEIPPYPLTDQEVPVAGVWVWRPVSLTATKI